MKTKKNNFFYFEEDAINNEKSNLNKESLLKKNYFLNLNHLDYDCKKEILKECITKILREDGIIRLEIGNDITNEISPSYKLAWNTLKEEGILLTNEN